MTDFKKRHKEASPTPNEQEYLGVVRDIKKDCDQSVEEICSSTDLEKRMAAYQNFQTLRQHYKKRINRLSDTHRKKIEKALNYDLHRVNSKLESTPISIYFEIDGLHIPIYHPETKKPFSLLEFFQSPYLNDAEVAFTAHLSELDLSRLQEYFPGIEQIEKDAMQELHPFQHLMVKTDTVAYDVFFKGRKGWDIEGKGRLRHLSKHLHFDIPTIQNPGRIDDLFKQMIEEVEHD